MKCAQCGSNLSSNSLYCENCGNKVAEIDAKVDVVNNKKRTISIIIIVGCFLLSIACFNFGKSNQFDIGNRADIIRVTQKLIEFTDENPVVGDSDGYKLELKKYKNQYNIAVAKTVSGYASSVIFLAVGAYSALIFIKKFKSR